MTQKIKTGQSGSNSMRVLDALTPMDGTAAPAVNAEFLGQIHVDTVAAKAYIAVAVGSVDAARDWKEITNAI